MLDPSLDGRPRQADGLPELIEGSRGIVLEQPQELHVDGVER
jgi:hypothetical protein